MRCFDAGIENVVAPCGTALTEAQAKLIRRYVPEVVVVFDADPAGIRAALRGVGILTDAGLTVRAMTLPSGKDPDDYIKAQGARAFSDLVDNAPDFVTFYIRMSETRTGTIEGRTDVARELFDILASLNDELRREEYLKRTAQGLGLNEWTCRGEFAKHLREQTAAENRPSAVRPEGEMPEVRRASQDDLDFVSALIGDEHLLKMAQAELAGVPLPDGALRDILGALFEGAGLHVVTCLDDDAARALYAAAANSPDVPSEKAREVVTKRVARIKRDSLKVEQNQVMSEIREAERAEDSPRVMALMWRKADISRKLDSVAAGPL
jgi:DNA primase